MSIIQNPSKVFVQDHGAMLRSMGADKVEATSPFQITVGFNDTEAANNASVAFNDSVYGAKLVVESLSDDTREYPAPTLAGVSALLSKVADVRISETSPMQMSVTSPLPVTVFGLEQLLRPEVDTVEGNTYVTVSFADDLAPA